MYNTSHKFTALVILTSLIAFSASAQVTPDLQERLDEGPDTERIDVIIQTSGPSDRAVEAVRNSGGNVSARFSIINGISATVPKVAAENLAQRPFVERVDPDFQMETVLDSTTSQINATGVWEQNVTGSDVDVAVLDTGISDHGSLNVESSVDFTGEGSGDGNGHGTHVAGTVASQDEDYRGTSYGADLFSVKVLKSDGTGSASNLIEGIEWAVEKDAEVVSLSLGAPVEECDGEDSVSEALNNAYDSGTLPVVAAGNEGPDSETITLPGCAEDVVTVGSVGSDGDISSFSSRGPTADGRVKPDVVAPGESVTSTWNDGGFETLSGTSMATPHVSGTAALLLAENSSLTTEELKSIIEESADDLGYDENTQGAGLLNSYEAYQQVAVQENQTNETNQTEDFAPVIEEASPVSETVNDTVDGEGVDVNLSAVVSDNDSESLNISFEFANDTVIQEFNGSSEMEAKYVLQNLPENTSYEWKVEASDGNSTVITDDLPFRTASSENETEENETKENETRDDMNRTDLPPGLRDKEELPPAFTNETPANPGSVGYGLTRAMESISLALTFNPDKKAQKRLKYAERRLAEASQLEEDNPLRQNLINDYQSNVQKARELGQRRGQSQESDSSDEISEKIKSLEDVEKQISRGRSQANQGGPQQDQDTQRPENRGQERGPDEGNLGSSEPGQNEVEPDRANSQVDNPQARDGNSPEQNGRDSGDVEARPGSSQDQERQGQSSNERPGTGERSSEDRTQGQNDDSTYQRPDQGSDTSRSDSNNRPDQGQDESSEQTTSDDHDHEHTHSEDSSSDNQGSDQSPQSNQQESMNDGSESQATGQSSDSSSSSEQSSDSSSQSQSDSNDGTQYNDQASESDTSQSSSSNQEDRSAEEENQASSDSSSNNGASDSSSRGSSSTQDMGSDSGSVSDQGGSGGNSPSGPVGRFFAIFG